MRSLLRLSVLCALVMGVMAVAAGAASAAPPCGGSSCTASYKTDPGAQLHVVTAASTANCDATLAVTANDPSGSVGNLSVAGGSSSISNCSDNLGSSISVTTSGTWSGTWTGTTTSGSYTLEVNKIHVSATNLGSTCTFDLTGTISGTYGTSAGRDWIDIPTSPVQSLTVSNSNGAFLCGLIGGNNGNTMSINGKLWH